MTTYECSHRGRTPLTVEAASPEEAACKAAEQTRVQGSWLVRSEEGLSRISVAAHVTYKVSDDNDSRIPPWEKEF